MKPERQVHADRQPRRTTTIDHDPQALRTARVRRGWRQNALAAYLGVSASTLCEAEKGSRGINPALRVHLASVLDCDPITFAPNEHRTDGSGS